MSHADQMRMHMQGMWIAFGVAAAFISYFVTRVRHSLAQREAELAQARTLAARGEKLASLATLATGAAHELSTPLSTIAVVANELERNLRAAQANGSEQLIGDAQLIRREVARCRDILQRMAADAEQSSAENMAEVDLRQLLASAIDGMPRREQVRVEISDAAAQCVLRARPQATAQALRSVLKNAVQASTEHTAVTLAVAVRGGQCVIDVQDSGSGMNADVLSRAGEPFFTTKEPGEGMGLGLFLTRIVIERGGGSMELSSEPGLGTRVTLSMPIR